MSMTDYMYQKKKKKKKKKKEGERGLTRIEDSVDTSVQWLEDYIQKRWSKLITVIRNNTDNIRTNWKITIKQKWEEKQL